LKYLIKRFLDLTVSIAALAILLPVFVFIALAVKCSSKGPVFFGHKRITKNGRLFMMYKFRTMIENAEHTSTGLFNYPNDFRVTETGRFLRKSSMDELPQLFNVIRGDMAVVGPRPPISYELGDYARLSQAYKRRFTVLPGITGLAQVSGRNSLTWNDKVAYDNHYIDLFEKYGPLIDIGIILMTILTLLKMRNICETKDEQNNKPPSREGTR